MPGWRSWTEGTCSRCQAASRFVNWLMWIHAKGCRTAGRLVDWQVQVHSSRCRTADSNQGGEQEDTGSRVVRQADVGNGQAAEVQNRIQRRVRAKPGSISSKQRRHRNSRPKAESGHKPGQQSGISNEQSQTGRVYTGTSTGSVTNGRS